MFKGVRFVFAVWACVLFLAMPAAAGVLPCTSDADCEDGLFCTRDLCDEITGTCGAIDQCPAAIIGCLIYGTCDEENDECVVIADDEVCDNGVFCDGWESCDATTGNCVAVSSCPPYVDGCVIRGGICDEDNDQCLDELDDELCPTGMLCDPDGTCAGLAVDIRPEGCPNPVNLRSKGKLPVAVLGTDVFDVTTIDPLSVRLVREAETWQRTAPAMLEAAGESWTELEEVPTASRVNTLEFSAPGDVTAPLVYCGLGYPEDIPPTAVGAVCLVERGESYFRDKVQNAAYAGAVAAIIYNRLDQAGMGNYLGTLLEPSLIPAVSTSYEDGLFLSGLVGQPVRVVVHGLVGVQVFQMSPTMTSLEDVGAPFEGTPCDCAVPGPDGMLDLVLKFEVSAMTESLGLPDAPGELVMPPREMELTVSGQLAEEFGGIPVSGQDCILLRP